MNKRDAKRIALIICNEELEQMFHNAKYGITNWEKVSLCNKGFSKGVAWNILAKDFDVNEMYHNLAKVNMIREFGEFLPDYLKPKKKVKTVSTKQIFHQKPIF